MTLTLSMTATLVGSHDGQPWAHDEWSVTLRRENGFMTLPLPYRMGIGNRVDGSPVAPRLGDVLESLVADAQANEECVDVAEYAFTYGNPASPSDLRLMMDQYEQLKRQCEQLRVLVGDDYSSLVFEGPDDGWSSVWDESITLPWSGGE